MVAIRSFEGVATLELCFGENLNPIIAHFWNGTTGKIATTPRELRIATLTNNQTCGSRRALQVSI